MKTIAHQILLALALFCVTFSASAQDDFESQFNCFGVIAGRNTTVDGSVMMAHNEDDSGEQMLNVYQVARGAMGNGNVKYTWFEFPGMKMADAFMNEYGVAVASDGCPSREDRMDVTDGGVLYEVRTLIAQKAHSAREAVKLVGELVEKKGYNGSGRTYVVADCHEGWIISVVQGRHWVAQRVPDDEVMAIPNYYIIDKVDLSDTENFAGSKDIASYAKERGWWNPAEGPFSFRKAYTDPKCYERPSNVNRHQHAMQIIAGINFGKNHEVYPFSIKPKKKVSRQMLQKVLQCQYDSAKVKGGHPTGICTTVTILSCIFQLRSNMPVEIGAVCWAAAGRPCVEAFLPWYSGMTKSPEGWCRYASPKEAFDKHFTDVKDKQINYPNGAVWNITDRWARINTGDYLANFATYKAQKDTFQKEWYKKQKAFEKSLTKYYNPATGEITNRPALEAALNDFTAQAYEEYFALLKAEGK